MRKQDLNFWGPGDPSGLGGLFEPVTTTGRLLRHFWTERRSRPRLTTKNENTRYNRHSYSNSVFRLFIYYGSLYSLSVRSEGVVPFPQLTVRNHFTVLPHSRRLEISYRTPETSSPRTVVLRDSSGIVTN